MNRKSILRSTCFVLLFAFCSWGQDRALIDKYCVTCHNQKTKTAGLSLDTADFTRPSNSADVWEKVIRKVRAEMMPPVSAPNPNPGLEQSAVL